MILNKDNCKQVEGFNLIAFNWIALPMAWQSGVSFDSGILISWDKEKKSQWVQQMPTKEELHGFECLHEDGLNLVNCYPLSSLHKEAQEFHKLNGNVIMKKESELFGEFNIPDSNKEVEAIANFGRGPVLQNFKAGCHEKEEQDDWSYEVCQKAWLLTERNKEFSESIQKELKERYDLTYDVWNFTECDPEDKNPAHARISTCLVSLRAEESLDRRVILSQGEYSTGQYSNNQGTNICSPVFDFTTADIWRLLSATDWDVNDVYEKLYEIGVGIGDQRVGSLLNYAAVRQIGTVKALEPDLYARINARFQNVEFMAQFNRNGYFKIWKPKNASWDGHNHIKAGYEPEEITALSDRYEEVLKELTIPYIREGNEFKTNDPDKIGKPWFPLKDYMKEHPEIFA